MAHSYVNKRYHHNVCTVQVFGSDSRLSQYQLVMYANTRDGCAATIAHPHEGMVPVTRWNEGIVQIPTVYLTGMQAPA
jgi:hypothetical protein